MKNSSMIWTLEKYSHKLDNILLEKLNSPDFKFLYSKYEWMYDDYRYRNNTLQTIVACMLAELRIVGSMLPPHF